MAYFHFKIIIVGETWQTKIARTLQTMQEKNADVLVLTNLDEIACTIVTSYSDFIENTKNKIKIKNE